MTVAIIGTAANEGTATLVERWRTSGVGARLLSGRAALRRLEPGDVALGRLDVLPTLDGVEPGLLALLLLARRGVRVLNQAPAMLAAHDKLRTAALLRRAGLPHPETRHVRRGDPPPSAPVVLKPRFGSWGVDVALCRTDGDVRRYLEIANGRPWFRRHGVLAQAPIPASGRDIRVLVAGGGVIGAVERHAAPGEWRTNVSCGARSGPATITGRTAALATAAAAASGADFVGVDLLPLGGDSYVVLELNAAVDFDPRDGLAAGVYDRLAEVLGLAPATAR